MAAARSGNVDQGPLVLYRPTTPPEMLPPRSKPWKRSHSVRVAMQMRHRRERWKQGRPTVQKIWTITLTIFALLLVIAISSGAASGYAYYQSQLPRLQGLASQQIEQSTRIYDRNDQLLYTAYDNKTGIGTGRSTPVTYNYIPGVMQDAMIAAEDHTFWDNSGIDPQGILRAATQYSSSGSVQSGGSTITQQVIKNLNENLTHQIPQVALQRKIPEAALAIGLTQQYPKWKILEMYFNISPFGAQELGVDAAAEDYFGLYPKCNQNFKCIPAIAYLGLSNKYNPKAKPALLALARASLLAGMPQNPVSYDPTLGRDHKNLALERQDYVLQQMLALNMHINTALGDQTIDAGPITPDIIQQVEALTRNMIFPGFQYQKRAPHFVDWIISQMEAALGTTTDAKTGKVTEDESLGANLFLTGGFNIRTTIDADLETYVEKAVQRHLDQPEFQYFLSTYPYGPLDKYHNVNDSAVVVMNAKDGEILAMDGSADYKSKSQTVAGQYNAALSPRQPGSSFKPIVYATAFQMGWYPGIVLPDQKTYFPDSSADPNCGNFNTTAYCPRDYGGSYNNKNWNIQLDIANSFNIPAVKTLMFAGYNNVMNMAERMGITGIDPKKLGPSFALGTTGVSLLQMVEAYQVFANQGARVLPQSILDIWDNYGHNLYHFDPKKLKSVQVLSKQIAYLITSILTDENARSYEFENDHVLSMWDWTLPDGSNPQVAAKTGTTDSFKDNWTLGYTPNVVVGVWSGNANDEPMDQHVVGITGAAPIWHDVIERVSGRCNQDGIPCGNINSHTIFPPQPFPVPSGITTQEVNTVNGLAGSGYASLMLDSDVPQQSGLTTTNGNGNGTPTPTP
jgi:membrane peptidoglycan carboxypeptidase